MTKYFILTAIVLQISILVFMAGKREYIVAFGEQIYLRSAPIDPRDPFRGDFVRLRYEFSLMQNAKLSNSLNEQQKARADISYYRQPTGEVVYAMLKPSGEVYRLDYLTDIKPDQGIFLKGHTTGYDWRFSRFGGRPIKYGLEQYFVHQGKGKELEKKLGTRNGMQVPIEMQVAVGSDGTAVIHGHRWSQLGIQLEVLRMVTTAEQASENNQSSVPPPVSPKLKITLTNVSEQSLALHNPGDNCSFTLVWLGNSDKDYSISNPGCDKKILTENDLIHLSTGESYSVEMDFSLPRWFLNHQTKQTQIGDLETNERFRLEYRSPTNKQLVNLNSETSIWHGHLPTAAFGNRGRID